MDEQERLEFVRRPQVAILATRWTKGRVHALPIWYLYEDGVFKIIVERGSQKARNVERSGRATLVVDDRSGNLRHVMVEGWARVEDPLTYEQRLALHRHYRGDAAARAVVDKGGHETKVTIVLTPERWIVT
ncbi:MAG: pyridoxamine 5'-phosphate oxidase family protein [Dehalococcoidia bacterium]